MNEAQEEIEELARDSYSLNQYLNALCADDQMAVLIAALGVRIVMTDDPRKTCGVLLEELEKAISKVERLRKVQ